MPERREPRHSDAIAAPIPPEQRLFIQRVKSGIVWGAIMLGTISAGKGAADAASAKDYQIKQEGITDAMEDIAHAEVLDDSRSDPRAAVSALRATSSDNKSVAKTVIDEAIADLERMNPDETATRERLDKAKLDLSTHKSTSENPGTVFALGEMGLGLGLIIFGLTGRAMLAPDEEEPSEQDLHNGI